MRFATNGPIATAVAVAALLTSVTSLAGGQERPTRTKPTHVLFLCPHGAAKSVLASAYFERAAKERGLNVRVESGGTEPDPAVSPAVAAHLKKNGYSVSGSAPRKVTNDQLANADIVVSLGCDLSAYPKPRGRLERWDEVPGPGENFAAADDSIKKRVTQLIEELARAEIRVFDARNPPR